MAFPKNNIIFATYKKLTKNATQLNAIHLNSTCSQPTPRVLVQLHALRSNSTRFGPTLRSGGQLHALAANSTLSWSTPRSSCQLNHMEEGGGQRDPKR